MWTNTRFFLVSICRNEVRWEPEFRCERSQSCRSDEAHVPPSLGEATPVFPVWLLANQPHAGRRILERFFPLVRRDSGVEILLEMTEWYQHNHRFRSKWHRIRLSIISGRLSASNISFEMADVARTSRYRTVWQSLPINKWWPVFFAWRDLEPCERSRRCAHTARSPPKQHHGTSTTNKLLYRHGGHIPFQLIRNPARSTDA